MVDLKLLSNIEQGINMRPCPLCGGNHRVSLRQNSSHSFAISSTVGLVFPTGDTVHVEVEDGACEGFSRSVCDFLLSHANSFVKIPFDFI